MKLGRLKRVEPRVVWSSESADFTPWLARADNVVLLGEAIGVELEVEAREQEVGPFRADILCKNTLDDTWVLIENQLEVTDHKHLGQIITYAAGLDAGTVVWITTRLREEHRAALDWLNEITSDRVHFFGLEIEVWRIGNSELAPKFNLVCKPNDWRRMIDDPARRGLNPTQQLQVEYWEAFRRYVEDAGGSIRPTKPLPQNWMNLALGRTGFRLNAVASRLDSSTHEIRAQVELHDEDSKGYFAALYERKREIEEAVGHGLTWYSVPNVRTCRIFMQRPADLEDRNDWPNQHEWLMRCLEALDRIFRPIVANLEPLPPEDEVLEAIDD